MRGSEGNAVVTADVGRQATLLKQPLKDCESEVLSGRRKRFTGEEKTAPNKPRRFLKALLEVREGHK